MIRRFLPHVRTPLAVAFLIGLAVVLGTGTPAQAKAGGDVRPPAKPPTADQGARLFDDCIRWVARGGQGIGKASSFYVKLNAELDLEQSRHKGPMRLWWKTNDRFRWELTTGGKRMTKILNVNRQVNPPRTQMWIIQGNGQTRRMHGTAEGTRAIKQLQTDAERLGDLARFITLGELRGPGVRFAFAGLRQGKGTYAGNWAKISRFAQGAATVHFWLAYQKDQAGTIRATYPGVVRVDGDRRQQIPTEDYILKGWGDSPAGSPRAFRYPRSIDAYSFMPGSGQAPARFLRATVEDIKINAGIDESLFLPPRRRR
ncbi:MAG: hypothetical protein QNJ98_03800 [Planctomycetota bacterium]|nr:hypothetical protein [Planctomycetota bacterium]